MLRQKKCTLNATALWCLAVGAGLLYGQTPPWSHFTLTGGGPAMTGDTYVYDPASNRIIIFAGQIIGGTDVDSNWVITNANGLTGSPAWQQLSPTGTLPPGRIEHSTVYDQAHNRIIVFGGGQSPGGPFNVLFNDTWVLSNANGIGGRPAWTQLSPATPQGLPAGRAQAGAVYDPGTNRMTIFGGCNNGIMSVPNDVWVLTNANGLGGQPEWIQLAPTGSLPSARCSQVMTYDPTSNAMTVFGGCCPSMSDLWVLQHANGIGGNPVWQQVSQTSPAPGQRVGAAFGYDEQTNTLTVFGGYSYPPTYYDDVWLLKDANDIAGGAATWANTIQSNSAGAPTPGAGDGTSGYDSLSKRLMIMNVNDPSDLWVLSTRNGVDLSASAGVPPPAAIAQFQRAGIQYVVVEAPQSGGTLAGEQLDAFSAAGFKTAAYCFLYFDTYALPGDQQAQNCLNTIGSTRLATISFIALDVEDTTPPLAPPTTRTAIVSAALQAIAGAGAQPVIYTTQQAWREIVGNSTQFQSYPLWSGAAGSFHTDTGGRYCGDGVASLTPFTAFGGWTVQLGKQYDIGTEGSSCAGASLNGVKVDFDVFDVSLFP